MSRFIPFWHRKPEALHMNATMKHLMERSRDTKDYSVFAEQEKKLFDTFEADYTAGRTYETGQQLTRDDCIALFNLIAEVAVSEALRSEHPTHTKSVFELLRKLEQEVAIANNGGTNITYWRLVHQFVQWVRTAGFSGLESLVNMQQQEQ